MSPSICSSRSMSLPLRISMCCSQTSSLLSACSSKPLTSSFIMCIFWVSSIRYFINITYIYLIHKNLKLGISHPHLDHNNILLMLQHPLPSNCRFYVESFPPTLDVNSHLQILCYTNQTKERTIDYKIDWRKRVNGLFVPVTAAQGNSYTCTYADLGAYIIAEITSMDPIYSGTTVLEFGPVISPIPYGSLSSGISGIIQSANLPAMNSLGSFGCPPIMQSLPNTLAQVAQSFVPPQNIPPVNNHTIFLLGNGAQRQCDLKFTEHGMRIKDMLTDYCYKFRVNKRGPKFQQNISDACKILVSFDHKYVADLSKFLRSFDDNRFVMKLGDRGTGIIEMRFPAKQRKQTFMEAYQSIQSEEAAKQKSQTVESLFKTGLYNQIKTSLPMQQDDRYKISKPLSNKISMATYSGPFKQAVKKPKLIDDYHQGSLLNWMDNVLQNQRQRQTKYHTVNNINQMKIQNHIVGKQLQFQRNISAERQRQRIFNNQHIKEKKVSDQNMINLSSALAQLRKQNQEILKQNTRLALEYGYQTSNLQSIHHQLSIKEGVISDAYTQLSDREDKISRLELQNQKLGSLLKQTEKKANISLVELTELRQNESKIKEQFSRQTEDLKQRILALNNRNMEYEERVAAMKLDDGSPSLIAELQSQIQKYKEHIFRVDKELTMTNQQLLKLKSVRSAVSPSQIQNILRAEIIQLKHRLQQKQSEIHQQKTTNNLSLELSQAKARILQLKTTLHQRQSHIQFLQRATNPDIRISPREADLEKLLKERDGQIINLQAEIQMHRMRDTGSFKEQHLNAEYETTQLKQLRHEYQNMVSMRGMIEKRCEQLLMQNHQLNTIVQKLEFEIQYLQNNRNDPEVEDYKTEIQRMNSYIDEHQQQYSKMANQFEQYRQAAERKQLEYMDQIVELEGKLKNHSVESFNDGDEPYLGRNMQVFRRQNSMLVQQNENLRKHCARLTDEAKDAPRLRKELVELRMKLIDASQIGISQSHQQKKLAMSEILND